MLTGLHLGDLWKNSMVMTRLIRATRWNQYASNWPVTLEALRQLWEVGKVSELKSPFYEPIENQAKST